MNRQRLAETLLRLGFTAILLGYLVVWLPQPVVGLSFLGLEMGEWVKFLPQVRAGEIATNRNFFYLPPITLGLMMVIWTVNWPSGHWKTWALRGLAVLVALLAFPAFEAIRDEPPDQWILRLAMVVLVLFVALLLPFVDRLPSTKSEPISWLLIASLALLGIILPTWTYLAIRPAVAELIGGGVGVGPGVWLNGGGHLLVIVAALYFFGARRLVDGHK